jgi:hypothetical protein
MSTSQIHCSHCSKFYEAFKTAHGKISKLCPQCCNNQRKADEKRKDRIRNYQEEAKNNIENAWASFQRISTIKRGKEVSITKEEYLELIQSHCFFCNYFNDKEVIGIDRVDNTKDYIKENCVPCCKFCNRVKHILHPIFFVEKTRLIIKYQTGVLSDNERDIFYTKWKEYIHKSPVPYIYVKRTNEEKRKLPFKITKEQYEELIYKPCYLCGFRNRHGNSLDRIDNTKREYTIDNVLPCCSTCNMMKAFYNKDQFLNGIKKISENIKEIPESWNLISRKGFQIGAARTKEKETVEKEQQWRAKTIFKGVKAENIQEFKTKVIEQTKWSDERFYIETNSIFEKIKTSTFDTVEDEIKKLITKIRYIRLGRS